MTRNWTPRDALIDVLMQHLYVWAPGEAEARRFIESMADEMLQAMGKAEYSFVPLEPGTSSSTATEPDTGNGTTAAA